MGRGGGGIRGSVLILLRVDYYFIVVIIEFFFNLEMGILGINFFLIIIVLFIRCVFKE